MGEYKKRVPSLVGTGERDEKLKRNGNLSSIPDDVKEASSKSPDFSVIRERIVLREASQRILLEQGTILPDSQYYACGRYKIKKHVVLASDSEGQGAIRNVAHCASVWACPSCSSVIQHWRGNEIGVASSAWFAASPENVVYFMTLTVPHSRLDDPFFLWTAEKEALNLFWSSRQVKNCKKMISYLGRVTGVEMTIGDPMDPETNGWHIHQHIAIFGKRLTPELFASVENTFKQVWLECLIRVGLCKPDQLSTLRAFNHSLRLEVVRKIDKYLTKFSNEIGSPNSKCARVDGRYTPFYVLTLAGQGIPWAKKAWGVYYRLTKGKRQLVWSDGLKDYFKVREVSDQKVADWKAQQNLKNIVAVSDWRKIRAVPNAELTILWALSEGRSDLLFDFLNKAGIEYTTDPDFMEYSVSSPRSVDGGLSYSEFLRKKGRGGLRL